MAERRQFLAYLCIALVLSACTTVPSPTATPIRPPTVIVTLPPRTPTPDRGSADHDLGKADAYLHIVHYGDLQCEPCLIVARALLRLYTEYPEQIRLTWRHFPQPQNDKAFLAAQALEAAAAQGVFWQLHDLLFAEQAAWRSLTPEQFRDALPEYARRVGIADLVAFETALDAQTYAPVINRAIEEARQRGLRGAPALFMQGQPYSGLLDERAIGDMARLILLRQRQFAKQPALQINLDAQYLATLYTEKGEVEIELFTRAAPVAVNNFVFLARQGWYDNITFHLVTDDIVQTGDPSGSGRGTAGYFIVDEHDNGLLFDREGMVAMANQRGVPNSASSQFFITLAPQPQEGFNKQYTIFGRVRRGMDVLRRLTKRDPSDPLRYPNPPPGDKLLRVEITEILPPK
ncbi:MAG: peptidylprolyl isomerase [Anaerolineae bacterium]|nr:peptidylprolyl isomerase [Anaerolineae bacterium]MDW8297880.1 peptidylprolyl isomerase [Anaerolineae bacterium]